MWRSWLAYASGGRVVGSSSLLTPTMIQKRRNGKKGFGLINISLGLTIVILAFVVTQTNALQYLKGKLANGNPDTEVVASNGLFDPAMVSAKVNGMAPKAKAEYRGVTLRNVVTGKMNKGQLLEKTGYVSYFNYARNTPDWVAWELTAKEAKGYLDRKGYDFMPDQRLPKIHQVESYDYTGSGYDRGHMCPAGDMKWDKYALRDCFFMSNICPQTHELNLHSWERLESVCRIWASKWGSVYIICGPVYKKKVPEYIGREHRVAVPDGFFKVVATLQPGHEKGIAFYYDNSDVRQPMNKAVRTIDEIEKLTKFDFFSELPDDIENRIEAKRDLNSFK